MATEPLTGRAAALLTLLMAAPAQFAQAQDTPAAKTESSITVYGGERFGGSLTDSTTNSNINLQNGSSVALAVDIGLDRATQLELFFSRQNTALRSSAFASQNTGLTLDSYHLGGTAFIEEMGRGVYVMGGLGATTAKPERERPKFRDFFLRQSRCRLDGALGPACGTAVRSARLCHSAQQLQQPLSAAAPPAAALPSRAAVCSRARCWRVFPPASDSRARRCANDKLRSTSRASRSCGAPFAGIIGLRCHSYRPLLHF